VAKWAGLVDSYTAVAAATYDGVSEYKNLSHLVDCILYYSVFTFWNCYRLKAFLKLCSSLKIDLQ
jgi:hypothetical protein